jgi:hypothetical protein
VHTSTPEYAATADISTTLTSPQSWFSYIGVHNSIPEYVSTTSISIVMTLPFEKRFLKKWFLLKYHQNHQVLKRRSIEKEKKDKGKRKKAARFSSNKMGSQYFERRKTLQLQRSFLMWFHFLLLHHTILKTLYKIIEKLFLALFGPFFSLAIYMTWVVPFLFNHELHIFSL